MLFLTFLLLKAYTSVSKASLGIADHKELGKMMNTIIFHTKMVDSLVEMLVETSDLSIFWWEMHMRAYILKHWIVYANRIKQEQSEIRQSFNVDPEKRDIAPANRRTDKQINK